MSFEYELAYDGIGPTEIGLKNPSDPDPPDMDNTS
jgi:hypothetical protein